MIAIGFVAAKLNIIKQETTSALSNIVIKVAIPCWIVATMVTNYKREMLLSTTALPLFAFITIVLVNYPLGKLAARLFKINPANKNQFIYLNFIQNYYYLSIPLAQMLYGSIGVVYVFLYGFLADMVLWTMGVRLYDTEKKGNYLTQILNPGIIALVIGFVLAMLQVQLPELIIKPLQTIGSLTTPLAMLITGAIMANLMIKHAKKIFTTRDMYIIATIKLILVPVIILFLTGLVDMNRDIRSIIVMQAAMPCAFSAILFATQYKKDTNYPSAIALITTLISLLTIPLFLYLAGR